MKDDLRFATESMCRQINVLTTLLTTALANLRPPAAQMSFGSGFRSPTQQSPEQGEKAPGQYNKS